jgi:hypothetical protein
LGLPLRSSAANAFRHLVSDMKALENSLRASRLTFFAGSSCISGALHRDQMSAMGRKRTLSECQQWVESGGLREGSDTALRSLLS